MNMTLTSSNGQPVLHSAREHLPPKVAKGQPGSQGRHAFKAHQSRPSKPSSLMRAAH